MCTPENAKSVKPIVTMSVVLNQVECTILVPLVLLMKQTENIDISQSTVFVHAHVHVYMYVSHVTHHEHKNTSTLSTKTLSGTLLFPL